MRPGRPRQDRRPDEIGHLLGGGMLAPSSFDLSTSAERAPIQKATLARLGVRNFKPPLRKAPERPAF
jgi:hypothetical protein